MASRKKTSKKANAKIQAPTIPEDEVFTSAADFDFSAVPSPRMTRTRRASLSNSNTAKSTKTKASAPAAKQLNDEAKVTNKKKKASPTVTAKKGAITPKKSNKKGVTRAAMEEEEEEVEEFIFDPTPSRGLTPSKKKISGTPSKLVTSTTPSKATPSKNAAPGTPLKAVTTATPLKAAILATPSKAPELATPSKGINTGSFYSSPTKPLKGTLANPLAESAVLTKTNVTPSPTKKLSKTILPIAANKKISKMANRTLTEEDIEASLMDESENDGTEKVEAKKKKIDVKPSMAKTMKAKGGKKPSRIPVKSPPKSPPMTPEKVFVPKILQVGSPLVTKIMKEVKKVEIKLTPLRIKEDPQIIFHLLESEHDNKNRVQRVVRSLIEKYNETHKVPVAEENNVNEEIISKTSKNKSIGLGTSKIAEKSKAINKSKAAKTSKALKKAVDNVKDEDTSKIVVTNSTSKTIDTSTDEGEKTPDNEVEKVSDDEIKKTPNALKEKIVKAAKDKVDNAAKSLVEKSPDVKVEKVSKAKVEKVAKTKSETSPKTKVEKVSKAKVEKAPKVKVDKAPKAKVDKSPKSTDKKCPKSDDKKSPKSDDKKSPKSDDKKSPKATVGKSSKGTVDKNAKGTVEKSPKALVKKSPKTVSDKSPKTTSPKVKVEKATKAKAEKSPKAKVETAPIPLVGKTPKTTVEKTPKTMVEKISKPLVEKTPKLLAEKTPKPLSEKTPKPLAVKTPKPLVEKTPKPLAEKTPKSLVEKTPKPLVEKTPKTLAEKTPNRGIKRSHELSQSAAPASKKFKIADPSPKVKSVKKSQTVTPVMAKYKPKMAQNQALSALKKPLKRLSKAMAVTPVQVRPCDVLKRNLKKHVETAISAKMEDCPDSSPYSMEMTENEGPVFKKVVEEVEKTVKEHLSGTPARTKASRSRKFGTTIQPNELSGWEDSALVGNKGQASVSSSTPLRNGHQPAAHPLEAVEATPILAPDMEAHTESPQPMLVTGRLANICNIM